MQFIYPSYGLHEFKGVQLTRNYIYEKYGDPDQMINHNDYSMELKYESLGLRFYYLISDEMIDDIDTEEIIKNTLPEEVIDSDSIPDEGVEIEEIDPEIITIGFRPPFIGKTEDGIYLNKSTMEDVFRIMGKENWITAEDDKYWWVEYSGISFYVEKIGRAYPFDEKKHLRNKIIRITIPTTPREEDVVFNEDGMAIKSWEDFCIDGEGHQPILDEERAETICAKCGVVFSERMISIEHSGQRAFSAEERSKREQHGSPVSPLIPDIQMATMIDRRAPMSENLRKAVKWDSRYTWKQRNMIQATSEIKRIGELLHLPQHVKEHAIRLYRQAFQKGLLKGRSIKAMVCASLYYACGSEKVPRTLQEIVEVSDSNFHDVTRSYQTLIRELNLASPTISPGLLVSKYIADLNLTHQVEILAQKILTKYEKVYSLSGKDPKGLVAAALYIAAGVEKIKVSQTKIARAIGITEVTLRNRLREMQKYISRMRHR